MRDDERNKREKDSRRASAMVRLLVLSAVWLALCSATAAAADEIVLPPYDPGPHAQWKQKSFKGENVYTVVTENGNRVLKAESRGTASALYCEVSFDVKEFPILEWSWKISSVLEKGDAHTKEGDDYAARVYVVFPSVFFWRTKAVNYMWANRLPVGEIVPNAFTSNARMIAVRSGNAEAGRWVNERRNVYEDYRRAFGEDPPEAGGVAVMTDTDNTGGSAVAWYGPIHIRRK